MIVYVDIDETICISPEDRDYNKAVPIEKNIKKINKMYDNGDRIVYWTARGTVTGIDHFELTKKQLKDWGCDYTSLRVGDKPHYDIWIDDKAIFSEDYFK